MSAPTVTPILCCQCGALLAVLEQLPITPTNDLHCPNCGLGMSVDTTQQAGA